MRSFIILSLVVLKFWLRKMSSLSNNCQMFNKTLHDNRQNIPDMMDKQKTLFNKL